MAGQSTYTAEQRAAMASERKAFSRGVMEGLVRDFLAAAEAKAEGEKRAGRWDGLKQLRLDGLRDILAEVEDFDLGFLARLAHTHDLRIEFALVDRNEGIRFTDVGLEPSASEPDGAREVAPG